MTSEKKPPTPPSHQNNDLLGGQSLRARNQPDDVTPNIKRIIFVLRVVMIILVLATLVATVS
ncbi:MAG: hypothetical protein K0U36_06145 [Alphaproteobacteria bacterium]|nr:hypothetical protein [Alphaproteobacteria bacterium]